MKALFIVSLILSSGCFASHRSTNSALSQAVRFETTNSPCLDAMFVNMNAGSCGNILTVKGKESGVYYWCDDIDSSKTSWNTNRFLTVTHDEYNGVASDSKYKDLNITKKAPLCVDVHILMFVH